jgi:hypothetical protein
MKQIDRLVLSPEEIAEELQNSMQNSIILNQEMTLLEKKICNFIIDNHEQVKAFYNNLETQGKITSEEKGKLFADLEKNVKHIKEQMELFPNLSEEEKDSNRLGYETFQDFIFQEAHKFEKEGENFSDMFLEASIVRKKSEILQKRAGTVTEYMMKVLGDRPKSHILPLIGTETVNAIILELEKLSGEELEALSSQIMQQRNNIALNDELLPNEKKLVSYKSLLQLLNDEVLQIQDEIQKINVEIKDKQEEQAKIVEQEALCKTDFAMLKSDLQELNVKNTAYANNLEGIKKTLEELSRQKEEKEQVKEQVSIRGKSILGFIPNLLGYGSVAQIQKINRELLELEKFIDEFKVSQVKIESEQKNLLTQISKIETKITNLETQQTEFLLAKNTILQTIADLNSKLISLDISKHEKDLSIAQTQSILSSCYKTLVSPDFLSAKASQELEPKLSAKSSIMSECLENFKDGNIRLSQEALDRLSAGTLEPNEQAFVRTMSNSIESDNRSRTRSRSSSLGSRSSESTNSSVSSSSSGFSSYYGERKGAKQGGANASKFLEAGVYKNDQGETFLIKKDDDQKQKDIGEYLTSVVYQALAPDHGAQIDFIKHENGEVFLASKFTPGYQDFHKIQGDDERDARGELAEYKLSGKFSQRVYREMDNNMFPGGEYVGYAEAMAPSMIAGDYARHSGNFGLVDQGDGTKRMVSIDFGAAGRKVHFGREIDLEVTLPEKLLGEKNYYKRDHPQELVYTEEFSRNADKMAKIDISHALEAAWLNIIKNLTSDDSVKQAEFDQQIKDYGKQIGVSKQDLDSTDYKNKIRDHYIQTIKARQESLGKQFGTKARAKKLKQNPDLAKTIEEKSIRSAQFKFVSECLKLSSQDRKFNENAIIEKIKSEKSFNITNPQDLEKLNSVIETVMNHKAKGAKYKDQYISLIKIKNRIYIEAIKQDPKLAKDLVLKIQTIPGDVNDTEITYAKNQLPDHKDAIDKSVIKNVNLKLSEKDRLIAEGAFKLYSDGYTKIAAKTEGATPGFIAKDENGKMCIVKTGPKGREESEAISELFACKLGKAIFKKAQEMGAPEGISEGIPDVELVRLTQGEQEFSANKGYVKSIFFKDFNEVFKEMGLKERHRVGADKLADKYSAQLLENKPEQFKELCWYLAFRHVIRDLDGHSANFGTMTRNGETHMSLIDAGLAGRSMVGNPLVEDDLSNKRIAKNVIGPEASPNHLSDWGLVYQNEEFKKACGVLKDIFQKDTQIVQDSMKQSLQDAERSFGVGSVEKYCSNWVGLHEDKVKTDVQESSPKPSSFLARFTKAKKVFDIEKASLSLFDLHLERAVKLDEIVSGKVKSRKSSGSYVKHIEGEREHGKANRLEI